VGILFCWSLITHFAKSVNALYAYIGIELVGSLRSQLRRCLDNYADRSHCRRSGKSET